MDPSFLTIELIFGSSRVLKRKDSKISLELANFISFSDDLRLAFRENREILRIALFSKKKCVE